jgi:TolB-like protein
MKTTIKIVAAIAVLAQFSCGNSYKRVYIPNPDMVRRIKSIAIMPFENLTKFPDAGLIISDLCATEIYSLGKFVILERSQMQRLLTDRKIDMPEVIDRSLGEELGRVLGIEGVLFGSVSEFRATSKPGEREEPAVGVNARLVDVKTGSVIWAASYSMTSFEVFSEKDSINGVAQSLVRDMVESIGEGQ